MPGSAEVASPWSSLPSQDEEDEVVGALGEHVGVVVIAECHSE